MSTSLLAVVQHMPHIEPLPAYRRDPETSSIRSSAPSYVSEAPSYHSTNYAAVNNGRGRTGLPPANYAPGFLPSNRDRNGLSHLNFNINQWSSVYSSPQARHYHNVAARRTQLAMIEEQNLITALTQQATLPIIQLAPPPLFEPASTPAEQTFTPALDQTPSTVTTNTFSSATIESSPPSILSSTQPTRTSTPLPPQQQQQQQQQPNPSTLSLSSTIPPLEDPDLVGHAAATLARERRLYIARENLARRQNEEREAAALREEARRWDFLLAQMADWEERERGWRVFKGKMMAAAGAGAGEKGPRRGSARRVLFRFWK